MRVAGPVVALPSSLR